MTIDEGRPAAVLPAVDRPRLPGWYALRTPAPGEGGMRWYLLRRDRRGRMLARAAGDRSGQWVEARDLDGPWHGPAVLP